MYQCIICSFDSLLVFRSLEFICASFCPPLCLFSKSPKWKNLRDGVCYGVVLHHGCFFSFVCPRHWNTLWKLASICCVFFVLFRRMLILAHHFALPHPTISEWAFALCSWFGLMPLQEVRFCQTETMRKHTDLLAFSQGNLIWNVVAHIVKRCQKLQQDSFTCGPVDMIFAWSLKGDA